MKQKEWFILSDITKRIALFFFKAIRSQKGLFVSVSKKVFTFVKAFGYIKRTNKKFKNIYHILVCFIDTGFSLSLFFIFLPFMALEFFHFLNKKLGSTLKFLVIFMVSFSRKPIVAKMSGNEQIIPFAGGSSPEVDDPMDQEPEEGQQPTDVMEQPVVDQPPPLLGALQDFSIDHILSSQRDDAILNQLTYYFLACFQDRELMNRFFTREDIGNFAEIHGRSEVDTLFFKSYAQLALFVCYGSSDLGPDSLTLFTSVFQLAIDVCRGHPHNQMENYTYEQVGRGIWNEVRNFFSNDQELLEVLSDREMFGERLDEIILELEDEYKLEVEELRADPFDFISGNSDSEGDGSNS